MGRQPCCEKVGLKRGPWTMDEDNKLMNFILNNGIQCWRLVPKLAGLMRCGKSCRLRWINYLRPDLKRGAFTEAEEDMMIELHSQLGNRWSKIAAHFRGRTDNEIKNHWNTKIKKKMKLMGLDPMTHKPIDQQNSAGESEEINQKLEFHDSSDSPADLEGYTQMQQKTEGELICGSSQDKIESCIENMEMGSSIMSQNVETLENLCFDSLQNWIDNPFLWDGFGNLEEIFS
ncbi:hypothetical protein ACJIZ3_005230 [Penstemon smallii]|uniref:Uncharacterized protein n=1 Tax=Penstemon smallii TaxID=265156 RepID=A0ABD3S4J6_9LAMI